MVDMAGCQSELTLVSNTERTKKSVSFRVAKVDYWFHGRVFEQPYT